MKTSRPKLTRRKFFTLLGITGLGAALHTRWFEPEWLGIGRHNVAVGKNRNAEPLKVLQLSDFHPDTKDMLKSYAWELLLCGHTHGGQFYLPLIGTPFAPVRDKRFVKGLHRWDGRWIHITKGVGNLLGVRFNCRPEVSLLTLV